MWAVVASVYFQPKEESRPLFAECFRKIHLVTVPTPSFIRLWQWPFTSSVSCCFFLWAAISQRACFLSPLDPSCRFINLAWSFHSAYFVIYFVFPFSSNVGWILLYPSIFQGLSSFLTCASTGWSYFLPIYFLFFTNLKAGARGIYFHPVNFFHLFPLSLFWREQQPWTEEKRPGFRLISQLNRWPLTPLSLSLIPSVYLYFFIPCSHRGQQFCSLSFCNLSQLHCVLVSILCKSPPDL